MYDVLIIGGGPGGYIAAERAGQAGLKVVLFEKNSLGGVCLNEGCIPSKALLNSSKLYSHAKDSSAFGVTAENVSFDHLKVVKRKRRVVRKLVAGVGQAMKSSNVELVSASAEIESANNDGSFTVIAEGTSYTGKHLIIATGSEAILPPIEGVKEHFPATVITNREILELEEVPERLVVIGGGVIGLEMACYYHAVGSQVSVVEMLDHIAGNVDPEIGKRLQEVYEKQGMKFYLNARVMSVSGNDVCFEQDGERQMVTGDKILLSTGRRPVTRGFGLEKLDIAVERGAIVVNDKCQTSVPGVYAVGDVVGGAMLAHVAYREGEVAVNNILNIEDRMSTAAIPSVIYTDPEVAWVGKTEQEMLALNRAVKVVELPMAFSGRYVAETERGSGICRMILDAEKNTLAGVHLMSQYASEIIVACGVMIEEEMTLDEMKKIIFPHPTVGEIVREALFKL
ncbi:MAG: dihydrolipoyl dehydrogenase [Clostridiaceae bacterium]|jgi:dihydrolipoamide dehydrogenase|nr:dihydrolipoyl dehydrogenase [Clostridiaceae bacterium]